MTLTVLIVDDDDHICRIISSFLRKRNYSITTAFNGKGALDLFYSQQPDLVIIDILLPDIMGTEVFREIRESGTEKADIPVVLMSGISDVARRHYLSMCSHKPQAVLEKPFHLKNLLATIEALGLESAEVELLEEVDDVHAIDEADIEEIIPLGGRGGDGVDAIAEELSLRDVEVEGVPRTDPDIPQPDPRDRPDGTNIGSVFSETSSFIEKSRHDLISLLESDRPRAFTAAQSVTEPSQRLDVDALDKSFERVPSDFVQDTSDLFFSTKTTGLFFPGKIDLRVSRLPADLYGDVELPRLFFALFKDEFTGKLEIQYRTFVKQIYFYRGHAIFASSNLRRETFGDWLLSHGVISQQQHERCLEEMLQNDCRYGEALVELKIFRHQQLFQYLKEQCHDRIIETFQWRTGTYRLHADPDVMNKVTMYELNMVSIIAEGIAKYAPLGNILVQFNLMMNKFVRKRPNYYKFAQFLSQYHLFQKMNEVMSESPTVRDFLTESGLDLISTLRGIKMLMELDMVRLSDEPATEKSGVERNTIVHSDAQPLRDRALKSSDGLDGILKLYLKLKEADNYSLLGVERDADDATISEKYKELVAKWAPDKFEAMGDRKLLGKIREIFQKIRGAYEVLSDPVARARYDGKLDAPTERRQQSVILEGEIFHMKGRRALDSGDSATAKKMFSDAVAVNPGEATYVVYLGWATFLGGANDVETIKEAVSWMKKALVLNPESSDAYYYLGMIALRAGKSKYARRYLIKAQTLNPQNADARKALNELDAKER